MWKHKKHKNGFVGYYERDKKGERVFVLQESVEKKPRRITFESWQGAKLQGWKRY